MPGELFVVTAPSGTGKTTLLRELLSTDSRLRFSISYTTRPPRPGEISGKDYFFVTPEEFHRLKDQGALVEWVEQFGYWYGTSQEWVWQALTQGYDLIFDLDTRGAQAVKSNFPRAVSIFILPPSLEVLEQRLATRGDLAPAELARRLEQGRSELQEVPGYDYLVINDQLPQALEQLRAIIRASRCRTDRLWPELAPRFLR